MTTRMTGFDLVTPTELYELAHAPHLKLASEEPVMLDLRSPG